MLRATPRLRIGADALVFALTLFGVGYFHQGGGWNQNARFALVRSIVEDASFFIDNHLVYERAAGAGTDKGAGAAAEKPDPAGTGNTAGAGLLHRLSIRDGNFDRDGTAWALAWRSQSGLLLPVDPLAAGTRKLVAVDDVAASGDIAYVGGHFHPNKAPGASFLAVPGYALLRGVQILLGVRPDSWFALTIAAWLTSLLSVGVATALAAVLVLRLSRRLGSEAAARAAAMCFAFATMAWPYGTFLFEHNIIAAALLGGLYNIERARDLRGGRDTARRAGSRLLAAGLLVGYAAICNYTMAFLVPVFAIFLAARLRTRPIRVPDRHVARGSDSIPRLLGRTPGWSSGLLWYAAGVLVPFLAICAYNQACFSTPFTTNYAHQSALFRADDLVLGVFAIPRLDVLALLLFSPFRGLFFTSPVLLVSVAAIGVLWRQRAMRSWAALIATVLGFLLLVNASFNGWDGGWTAVPRYLGPAMGLLALPLAVAFDRWKTVTSGLAAVSVVIQLLLTAVDPQVPIGDVGTVGIAPREVFAIDPMKRYVVPLFTSGHAWPILDASIEQAVTRSVRVALERDEATSEIERKSTQLRSDLKAAIERGDSHPLELGGVIGPVSANPVGVYEGSYFRLYPAGSREAAFNSFNVGELLFARSRLSLLPLLLFGGTLFALLLRAADDPAAVAAANAAANAAATPVVQPAREP